MCFSVCKFAQNRVDLLAFQMAVLDRKKLVWMMVYVMHEKIDASVVGNVDILKF